MRAITGLGDEALSNLAYHVSMACLGQPAGEAAQGTPQHGLSAHQQQQVSLAPTTSAGLLLVSISHSTSGESPDLRSSASLARLLAEAGLGNHHA